MADDTNKYKTVEDIFTIPNSGQSSTSNSNKNNNTSKQNNTSEDGDDVKLFGKNVNINNLNNSLNGYTGNNNVDTSHSVSSQMSGDDGGVKSFLRSLGGSLDDELHRGGGFISDGVNYASGKLGVDDNSSFRKGLTDFSKYERDYADKDENSRSDDKSFASSVGNTAGKFLGQLSDAAVPGVGAEYVGGKLIAESLPKAARIAGNLMTSAGKGSLLKTAVRGGAAGAYGAEVDGDSPTEGALIGAALGAGGHAVAPVASRTAGYFGNKLKNIVNSVDPKSMVDEKFEEAIGKSANKNSPQPGGTANSTDTNANTSSNSKSNANSNDSSNSSNSYSNPNDSSSTGKTQGNPINEPSEEAIRAHKATEESGEKVRRLQSEKSALQEARYNADKEAGKARNFVKNSPTDQQSKDNAQAVADKYSDLSKQYRNQEFYKDHDINEATKQHANDYENSLNHIINEEEDPEKTPFNGGPQSHASGSIKSLIDAHGDSDDNSIDTAAKIVSIMVDPHANFNPHTPLNVQDGGATPAVHKTITASRADPNLSDISQQHDANMKNIEHEIQKKILPGFSTKKDIDAKKSDESIIGAKFDVDHPESVFNGQKKVYARHLYDHALANSENKNLSDNERAVHRYFLKQFGDKFEEGDGYLNPSHLYAMKRNADDLISGELRPGDRNSVAPSVVKALDFKKRLENALRDGIKDPKYYDQVKKEYAKAIAERQIVENSTPEAFGKTIKNILNGTDKLTANDLKKALVESSLPAIPGQPHNGITPKLRGHIENGLIDMNKVKNSKRTGSNGSPTDANRNYNALYDAKNNPDEGNSFGDVSKFTKAPFVGGAAGVADDFAKAKLAKRQDRLDELKREVYSMTVNPSLEQVLRINKNLEKIRQRQH